MSRRHRREILEQRRRQIWNRLLKNPYRTMTEQNTGARTQILLWGECVLRPGWRKQRFGYIPSYERA